jgi:hypothetical protein
MKIRYRTDYGYTYTDWESIPNPKVDDILNMLQSAESSRYDIAFHIPETGVRFGVRPKDEPRSFWFNQPDSQGNPGMMRYGFGTEFWNRVRRLF